MTANDRGGPPPIPDEDQPVVVPRWVAEMALNDHRNAACSYCRNDRQDLCRDVEFTDALAAALDPPDSREASRG